MYESDNGESQTANDAFPTASRQTGNTVASSPAVAPQYQNQPAGWGVRNPNYRPGGENAYTSAMPATPTRINPTPFNTPDPNAGGWRDTASAVGNFFMPPTGQGSMIQDITDPSRGAREYARMSSPEEQARIESLRGKQTVMGEIGSQLGVAGLFGYDSPMNYVKDRDNGKYYPLNKVVDPIGMSPAGKITSAVKGGAKVPSPKPTIPTITKPFSSLPVTSKVLVDLESKQSKIANLPVFKQIVNIFTKESTALNNPVDRAKILQGRLFDIIDQNVTSSLSHLDYLIKSSAKNIKLNGNIVTDKRVIPLPNAPKSADGNFSMQLHDIIEYSERYQMPDGLRKYCDEIRSVSKQFSDFVEKELSKYGVKMTRQTGESDWQYLHRQVKQIGEVKLPLSASWKNTQKSRVFDLAQTAELSAGKATYYMPEEELFAQIKSGYHMLAELQVKQELLKLSTTAKSRVPLPVIEQLIEANSKRVGIAKTIELISRALRGEKLTLSQINSVRNHFPGVASRLEQALAKARAKDFVDDFSMFNVDVWNTLKVTQQQFREVLTRVRGGRAITKPDPITRGEVTQVLTVLGQNKRGRANTVWNFYKNRYINSQKEKRTALLELREQVFDLQENINHNFQIYKKAYKDALEVAGPSLSKGEGKSSYLGNRIVTGYTTPAGKRISGIEIANQINEQFGYNKGGWGEKLVEKGGVIGGLLREMKASLDLSVTGVQTMIGGFGLDFYNLIAAPVRAARGIPAKPSANWLTGGARSWQAAFNPKKAAEWFENPEVQNVAQDIINHGGNVLTTSEYAEQANILSKVPVVGKLYERAAAAFTVGRTATMLAMYQSEKARVLRNVKPENVDEVLTNLAKWCNLATGTMSTRGAGISEAQRAIESVFMFAPKFQRSTMALIGDLAAGGLKGSMSRKAITGLIAGATATITAAALALGQKPRINPLPESMGGDGSKYLTVDIGNTAIGFGSSVFSLMRLLANVVDKVNEGNEEDFVKLDMDNPMIRYLRGKLGPVPALGVDYISGKGYMGNLTRDNLGSVLLTLGEWAVPINVEEIINSAQRSTQLYEALVIGAASTVGGRVLPQSDWDIIKQTRENYTQQLFPGKTYEDLNKSEIEKLNRAYPDLVQKTTAFKEKGMAGDEIAKSIATVTTKAVEKRDKEIDQLVGLATAGTIDRDTFDKRYNYLKPYYSGARNAIWQLREQLTPETVKRIDKWLEENEKPEDKATDDYNEYRAQLIEQSGGNINWDEIEVKSKEWIDINASQYADYIYARQNAWWDSLSKESRDFLTQRDFMMNNGTWWKGGYNGPPQPRASTLPDNAPVNTWTGEYTPTPVPNKPMSPSQMFKNLRSK